ncbi:MAG: DMT family transporter [Actinomycetota bacterium]|jgi:drug/metabolite transporter (DMT)-like permease|nr:DMT family transporter [Actinomycetota bacterium]
MAAVIIMWGLGPPISKLITAPPVVIASVRFWASVPILLAVTYAGGRRLTRETLRHTWIAGSMFGMNMVFVFLALQNMSVAVMSVLMALQPGVVLIAAGRWMGERATRWHVGWTLVGIIGVSIVVLGNGPDVEISAVGLMAGVGALLSFTVYYLRNRVVRSTVDIHPLEWMSGSTLFSAIAVTPFALIFTDVDDYRLLGGVDWVYLFYVAGVVGIFSHTLMSWVHKFIPATRSSLYMLGMTVVAVVAAWPINGESVTPQQFVGGLVVLGAVAAVVSRPPVKDDGPATDGRLIGPPVDLPHPDEVYIIQPLP